MKHVMLAVPATLLFAAAAFAQTDTTTGTDATTATTAAGTSGEKFGTNWPLSVGTTFFTDADSTALRPTEEVTKGWQSLSPEDQTMIKTDCEAFMAVHGGAGDTATTGTATDPATDGTASTDMSATGTASSDAGTDAATSAPAGYDMAEMKAICGAVGAL